MRAGVLTGSILYILGLVEAVAPACAGVVSHPEAASSHAKTLVDDAERGLPVCSVEGLHLQHLAGVVLHEVAGWAKHAAGA